MVFEIKASLVNYSWHVLWLLARMRIDFAFTHTRSLERPCLHPDPAFALISLRKPSAMGAQPSTCVAVGLLAAALASGRQQPEVCAFTWCPRRHTWLWAFGGTMWIWVRAEDCSLHEELAIIFV